MPAVFGILTLPLSVVLICLLQMAILTTVIRGISSVQHWIYWRTFFATGGWVIAAHVISLFIFSTVNDYVGAGSLADFDAILHAAAVLWPLQAFLFAVDSAIRALHARQEAKS